MHWPKGIQAQGEICDQFHHLIDVAPTALEATKVPQPKTVNGIAQRPMDGVSMVYSTADPNAADPRSSQYFEIFGNRAIYHDDWIAAKRHSIPWGIVPLPPVKDDVELYKTRTTSTATHPHLVMKKTPLIPHAFCLAIVTLSSLFGGCATSTVESNQASLSGAQDQFLSNSEARIQARDQRFKASRDLILNDY